MKSSSRTLVSNTPSRSVRALRKPALLGLAIALGALAQPALAQGAAAEPEWAPGRLLVQPRPGLSDAELAKIIKPHGGKLVGKIDAINVHFVQLPPQASEKAIEALLKHNKHLKFVERDMLVRPDATSNDPYFGNAWHLPKVGANTAWDLSRGAGVTIAILDSGVDPAHPDLAGKLVPGWNFYDNNSNTSDVYGHGTQVAGTAAALTNNSIGVASIAGDARIMPLRISATNGSAYFSAMAQALTWAADNNAKVANISYQSVSGSSTVASAAQYLKGKGGVTVVAAGNTGVEQAFAPSDTMISVSATDSADNKASWSSYGNYVDVAAPGVGIWTTANGGGYGAVSGTSFASPITAGVVALMMAANPALSPAGAEQLLFATAVDLGAAGVDSYYGNGRINAAAAVQAAAGATSADTSAPSVSINSPSGGSTVKGLVAVDVAASDNVGVSRVDLMVNGTKIASDITAPYGFSWDSTTIADGNVTLAAYAYDAAGNYASRAVSVSVANATVAPPPAPTIDKTPPVAKITNPGQGSKVSGNLAVTASATDDVGVTSLRLYIDNELVDSVDGDSISYRWNTRKVTNGSHTLRLEAEDAAGNKGSQSISVTR